MAFGSLENSRMKFIRNATSISASETRPSKGAGKNPWSSVQLVNPQESNLAFSAGIVEHDSKDTTQLRFRWHEVVLVLDGEMVVQDVGSGGVYKAHKGDLFYLGPNLDARIGGKFKAYHVTTPPLLRHIKGSQGEADVVSLLEFGEELE